jgi:hypothetical protein
MNFNLTWTRRTIPNLSGGRGGRGRTLLVADVGRGATYRVREVPFQGWAAQRNEEIASGSYRISGGRVFPTQQAAVEWCREDAYVFLLERSNFYANVEGGDE